TGSVSSRRLAGTENAAQPFWSHDSRFIGFVSGDKLRKVDANGGAVNDVTDAPGFSGGAWGPAGGGTILFGSPKGINRVSAQGGSAAVISELGQGETGHFWPSFLPDAKHYLFLAWSEQPANRAIHVGSLDSKTKQRLMQADSNAMYAAA